MEITYDIMLKELQKKFVPFYILTKLYGILREDQALFGAFRSWANLFWPQGVVDIMSNDYCGKNDIQINRYAFETFLQQSNILPIKIAAAHLGMSTFSFTNVLDKLQTLGIINLSQQISPQVISASTMGIILRWATGYKSYNDHNSACIEIHTKLESFDLKTEKLYCVTSEALKRYPPYFAYEFDCLSDDPISLYYQVWLDFKKPVNLKPDSCSIKLFVEHQEELSKFVFAGKLPTIPGGLLIEKEN